MPLPTDSRHAVPAAPPSDAPQHAAQHAPQSAPQDAAQDEAAAHYQAFLARDARFDGRLFVGVSTTGVYCRPVCRVRVPRRENCRFFATAAQAEAARFRPCLKCRPELAPGPGLAWSVMDASRTLARQAAALLDSLLPALPAPRGEAAHHGGAQRDTQADGTAAPSGIAAVAARLGISERHLRRIFLAEHGVTPLQYLQTRRLLLAKHLLTDTALPIVDVALASGFGSLRRFNAAFAERYRMSPARVREGRRGRAALPVAGSMPAHQGTADEADGPRPSRARPGAAAPPTPPTPPGAPTPSDDGITVHLGWRPPLEAERLLAFFAQRAIPGIEVVDAHGLRRSVRAGTLDRADDGPPHPAGWVQVRVDAARRQIQLRCAPALVPVSARLIAAVRRWFDLDAQPALIDTALSALPGAGGMRLPGSLDGFELMVRAVLGQQVTVAGARTLARRLVDRFGQALTTPWADVHRGFPDPATLAALPAEALAELGIIRSRAQAIVALARAWPELHEAMRAGSPPEPLIQRLCAVPGIGPWTAHYVAMRALGWPDAWPPGDVAVLKALRLGLGGEAARIAPGSLAAERAAAQRVSAAFRPWRSYAVMRLWDAVAPAAPVAPSGAVAHPRAAAAAVPVPVPVPVPGPGPAPGSAPAPAAAALATTPAATPTSGEAPTTAPASRP